MVTVHRAHGFRFVIFANDHEPAHAHVFGQGGEAKILFAEPDLVQLEWFVGLSRADARRLLEEAELVRANYCLRGGECMEREREQMIAAADRRGPRSLADEPRARSARYDRRTGRIVVALTNGCSFAFPARLAQGLENASDVELAQVETLGAGFGLHWETLDVDLSVPGLLAGLFGTRKYMDRLRASHAGATKSKAKAAAARRNGAKGGRPKKRAVNRR